MAYFTHFYLDREKDMLVTLHKVNDAISYVLSTPNHSSGNLISNFAKLCNLKTSLNKQGLKIIQGKVPCYYNEEGNLVYIFRLNNRKIANIFPDGRVEKKASVPAICKTLMSQTKNYQLDFSKTVVKTFIKKEVKFHTDLHTHMNANLNADVLIALGIKHQIQYPLYYIKKLHLKCSKKQEKALKKARALVEKKYKNSSLQGKYLERKIDDNTFINFADFICNNLENAKYNIPLIRSSLSILKDGQAVFTNLEKVYLYRYVFTKGIPSPHAISLPDTKNIGDNDIVDYLLQMEEDAKHPAYKNNTLFQDELLWIARTYQRCGICYAEISDTTLVKPEASIAMLKQVHAVMPAITQETGVLLRFLAAFRRIPLTIIRDFINANNYEENLKVFHAVLIDPYVAGCDIVGEEMNDIRELQPLLKALTSIAKEDDSMVIRIHAGENDSLKNNVYHSICCIEQSLGKGQKMPKLRIGHGLYTTNLQSNKGKALMAYIKKCHVTLEFQITSNVRLNNLSDLSSHPLKHYLNAGVSCVQGSDGGAIYGTNALDEQLALINILQCTDADLNKMVKTEQAIIRSSLYSFQSKKEKLQKLLKQQSYQSLMESRLHAPYANIEDFTQKETLYPSSDVLKDYIRDLPLNKKPIVLAGGSFNNDSHVTKCRNDILNDVNTLIKKNNPETHYFVIGPSLKGYESYLLSHNRRSFEIYAFVPSVISKKQANALKRANVAIRVAIEPFPMGIYKSIAYEIFKRRDSILLALDGNSSCANLIQEAKNGKYHCDVFVNKHALALNKKATSLSGYVTLIGS